MKHITKIGVIAIGIVIIAGSIFYACKKEESLTTKTEEISLLKEQKASGYLDTIIQERMTSSGKCLIERIVIHFYQDKFGAWYGDIVHYRSWLGDCSAAFEKLEMIEAQMNLKDGVLGPDDDESTRKEKLRNFDNYEIIIEGELLTPAFSKTIYPDYGEAFTIDYDFIVGDIWPSLIELVYGN